MGARATLFLGGGGVLVLLGVVLAAVGGYASFVIPCGNDARLVCLDVWSYVAYVGGIAAVVGTFGMLFGWVLYAYR